MDPSAMREQIDKILLSQSFANKSQLRKLLEVLSKNADSQAALKPDVVIRELWPDETRTKRSADVATEMNRLRHALEAYYEGEGKNDPIAINLPNRSASATDGKHEKRWIVAWPRNGAEFQTIAEDGAALKAKPRRNLKAISAIAALCMAVGVMSYFSIRALGAHEQPKFGRMDGSTLEIFNAEGKELWRKAFPDGFSTDSYYAQGLATRIWFGDLEGKGHTSVLFSYLPAADSQPHSSTLFCYSDRGKEKWHWNPRERPEATAGMVRFKTFALGILKATQQRPSRIVVLSDLPWLGGPSQLTLLDAHGQALSEYWHAGGLRGLLVADVDGDGREEIIATGVARGYGSQATLLVLDADRLSGESREVESEFQLPGSPIAQERLRLLFPRSDLNRESFQYDLGIEPTVENGNLRLKVLECVAPIGCPIQYEFDRNFHLLAAHPANDEFRGAHDRFYQTGKDAHTFAAEEQAAFLRVRCLVGCQSDLVPLAQTYDPATSFEKGWSVRTNPNGVWSYGYSSGFTDPMTLYDKTARNGINGPNAEYWLSSSVNKRTSPAAEYNNGPANNDGNVAFLRNELVLVAGIDGQYSDLQFTAPADGDYSIAGSFRGAQYGVNTNAGVVANGKVVFRANVTSVSQLAPFQMTLHLLAGNTVVFTVGPNGGSQNTGISATITRPCAPTDRPAPAPTGEITCSGRPTRE